jgi:hypothetical protein
MGSVSGDRIAVKCLAKSIATLRSFSKSGLPNGGRTCDGSVATWRAGKCPVQAVVVKIPFAEVGDFIYHCHIGNHQDGGMMAHIKVIATQ